MNKREELREKQAWLRGVVDAMRANSKDCALADRLNDIAGDLGEAASNICSQGYYGCRSDNCQADHK